MWRAKAPSVPLVEAPPLVPDTGRAPTILVFDSGLGGLTVQRELARARPDAHFVYVADDAAFPYGRFDDGSLIVRVLEVMTDVVPRFAPDCLVIACNTASTLVLPVLRARFPGLPVVGTVPAVKPACAGSTSRRVSILATRGTILRDYTRDLIRKFAGDCRVTLVGSVRLAGLAEAAMRGHPVDDDAIRAEITPAFVEDDEGRTDTIALACTHYPLLASRMAAVAPWPVRFVDPAPAIARRVVDLLGPDTGAMSGRGRIIFTSSRDQERDLTTVLSGFGLELTPATSLA